jgi:hypothetical protein
MLDASELEVFGLAPVAPAAPAKPVQAIADPFPDTPTREPGSDDGDPTPSVDVAALSPLAAVVPPAPPPADPALPPPAKRGRPRVKIQDADPTAAPAPQGAPVCGPCGAALSPENGSQLKGGEWKHIGCPSSQTPAPAPAVATVSAPAPVPAPAVQAPDLPLPAESGSVWRIASDFQILSVDGDRVTVSIRLEALLSKLLR